MDDTKNQSRSEILRWAIYSLVILIVLFPILLGSIYIYVEEINNYFPVYLWVLIICIFEVMFASGIYILKKKNLKSEQEDKMGNRPQY